MDTYRRRKLLRPQHHLEKVEKQPSAAVAAAYTLAKRGLYCQGNDPIKLVVSSVIQLGSGDFSGKVKLKVEPLPTSLSTQIFSSFQFDELLGQDWPKSSPFSCERSRLPPGEIPQESLAVLRGDADVGCGLVSFTTTSTQQDANQ